MLGVAFSNQRLDTPRAKRLANLRFCIISLVAKDFLRTATASATRLFDRRDGVDQWDGLLRIVDVRAGVDQGQRRALSIGGHMKNVISIRKRSGISDWGASGRSTALIFIDELLSAGSRPRYRVVPVLPVGCNGLSIELLRAQVWSRLGD